MGVEVQAPAPKRRKGCYIGAPKVFVLEAALKQVCQAFGVSACYQVGSSLERPDWRDVDIRLILADDAFAELFPDAGRSWSLDPRWLLLTVAISEHLSRVTGLPIDFQFQPRTHANEAHPGPRNAMGLRLVQDEP